MAVIHVGLARRRQRLRIGAAFTTVEKTQEQSWSNATYALFDIVNRQLTHTRYKFYAVNGGNELGGMFLTLDQYKAAVAALRKKTYWPYIPDRTAPWYGQSH